MTNATLYGMVSSQFHTENLHVFDVLENIVVLVVIPISTFVVVDVATMSIALGIAGVIMYNVFIDRRYTVIFLIYHAIHLELGIINSSGFNFFVYALRSSRFRQELA